MEFKPEEKYGFKLRSGKYTTIKEIKNKFDPKDLTIRELGKLVKGAHRLAKEDDGEPEMNDVVDSVWERIQCC